MSILKPDKTFTLGGVTVNEYLLTKHNPNGIDMPSEAMNTIIGVTIHNTDWITVSSSTTPAEQYTRATVNGNMNDVRVHYYVDNRCAWQNLPLNLHGWHAADGKGDGNMKTIAIECLMSNSYNDTDKKSEDNCARLAAALLRRYNLGIDRLYTHNHWYSKKYCPAYILPHWNSFKNKVASYMNKLDTSTNTNVSNKTDNSSNTNTSVKTGDLVTIKGGATYYKGENIPSWVKEDKWYISSVSGDRAILGLNEAKNRNIQSPINTKNISVIKSTMSKTVSLKSTETLYETPGGKTKGTIGVNGVFTIVDEVTVNGTKYGKLKSGAGYVKLTNKDNTIRKGDTVKVLNNVQYNGKSFKVYCSTYKVLEVNGDRVVISSDGKNVTAAVNAKNLQKV